MLTWLGSAAAGHTLRDQATMTSTVSGWFDLGGIRFYAASPRTYTVTLDGTPVGSVVSPGDQVEEVTFTPRFSEGSVTIQIIPDTAATVHFTSGTTFEYAHGITQGEWAEYPNYRLPWELLIRSRLGPPRDAIVVGPALVVSKGLSRPAIVLPPPAAGGGSAPNPASGRSFPRGRP